MQGGMQVLHFFVTKVFWERVTEMVLSEALWFRWRFAELTSCFGINAQVSCEAMVRMSGSARIFQVEVHIAGPPLSPTSMSPARCRPAATQQLMGHVHCQRRELNLCHEYIATLPTRVPAQNYFMCQSQTFPSVWAMADTVQNTAFSCLCFDAVKSGSVLPMTAPTAPLATFLSCGCRFVVSWNVPPPRIHRPRDQDNQPPLVG